jgi:hypothetical protein
MYCQTNSTGDDLVGPLKWTVLDTKLPAHFTDYSKWRKEHPDRVITDKWIDRLFDKFCREWVLFWRLQVSKHVNRTRPNRGAAYLDDDVFGDRDPATGEQYAEPVVEQQQEQPREQQQQAHQEEEEQSADEKQNQKRITRATRGRGQQPPSAQDADVSLTPTPPLTPTPTPK